MSIKRCILSLLTLGFLLFVLLLALKPTPAMLDLPLIPNTCGLRELDNNDPLRNTLGFFILASLALALASVRGRIWHPRQILALLACAALVPSLEIAQFFLPGRNPDFADALFGWLGLFLAAGAYAAVRIRLDRKPCASPVAPSPPGLG